ncbi:hypothetical protein [Aquimarina rhabdastrellae]
MFKKLFKKKTIEIDFDTIGFKLSDQGKESIKKFCGRTAEERMGDIMYLGNKGNPNFFYLIYYAILFDRDLNVRFAALKRASKFKEAPNFDMLLDKLDKLRIGESLEPYYSMMLYELREISLEEFKKRMNGN